MKLKKPQFWDYKNPNFLAHLLWPLSILFQTLNSLIKIFVTKKKFDNIKTICVGNIYIGGTGKTSLSLKIQEILEKKNIKTCFIKKNYSNQIDEQKILEKNGMLFMSNKRIIALKTALDQNYRVAIFDDGLQDMTIDYDLSFVCFNNLNWIGNGNVIPSGPLRENVKNIKKFNYIFLNGNLENLESIKEEIFKINPKIKIFIGKYVPQNLDEFDNKKKYLAFSGIGNHSTFVSMLKKNNFNVIKDIEYPDHYNYSKNDMDDLISISQNLDCDILTTEKDYIRLKKYKINEIRFVSVKIEIINEEKFIEILSNVYE